MPALDVLDAWPVVAYIGPGAGLDLLGYALSMILFALTALSAVLLWPVYALLRRLRGGKKGPAPAPPAEGAPGADRATSHADQ